MPGTGNMLSPTVQLPKLWAAGEATKSADYTVTIADSGTLFYTGGGANRVFTLPALVSGTNFWAFFVNNQNNNMTITAPANKLVTLNNLTATNAIYSTANQIIGAACVVWMNDAGTFYYCVSLNSATVTPT